MMDKGQINNSRFHKCSWCLPSSGVSVSLCHTCSYPTSRVSFSEPALMMLSHPTRGQLTEKALLPNQAMLWVNNFRGQWSKTRKVHKKKPWTKNKASQNMPWWVEATRCLFPIATDIPQHVGRRKRRAAVLPPIHLMCMFQFISVLQFFTYAFSNIWIVGSVSTYSLGARRNPLHARLYTHIYI